MRLANIAGLEVPCTEKMRKIKPASFINDLIEPSRQKIRNGEFAQLAVLAEKQVTTTQWKNFDIIEKTALSRL